MLVFAQIFEADASAHGRTLRPRGAFSAGETFRFRLAGFQAALPRASIALRRSASTASAIASLMPRLEMSISIRLPSSTRAIRPPSAASGET
jgi:hypothetical protein